MERHGNINFLSDLEIIRKIGKNIRTTRLNRNITRDELQNTSGIHSKTIGEIENGKNVTLSTLIAILRGLNMLDRLEALTEEANFSPVLMFENKGKPPQRARRSEK